MAEGDIGGPGDIAGVGPLNVSDCEVGTSCPDVLALLMTGLCECCLGRTLGTGCPGARLGNDEVGMREF